ncbi:MAG: alpha-L-fucosidase, partial [Victivallaceae bacterium]
FAMYHSKVSKFNIVDATPFGRDVLRELADACRKHDFRFGIYYSHNLDWSDPDGGDPGPNFVKNCNLVSWSNDWDYPDLAKKNFERYFRNKALPQITELLTNYGPVCELWCDCPLTMEKRFSEELRDLVRRLQPDCMINSRIGNGCGDFGSLGDNQTLSVRPDILMESPGTLNRTWGYKRNDHDWKTPEYVIEQLVSLTDKGANYLLNVGPRPDGQWTPETKSILSKVGEWYERNGSGILGSGANPFPQNLSWAYCTTKGNDLNFFLRRKRESYTISGISGRVVEANCRFQQKDDEITFFPDGADGLLPLIRLTFDRVPAVSPQLREQGGNLALSPTAGVIRHGDTVIPEDENESIDAAGGALRRAAHSFIERDGSLAMWHNPADTIEWQVEVPAGGNFYGRLLTQMRDYDHTWSSSRVIELAIAGVTRRIALAATELPDSPHFRKVVSDLGEWIFPAGFSGKVTLRTLETGDRAARNMSLQELSFTRR